MLPAQAQNSEPLVLRGSVFMVLLSDGVVESLNNENRRAIIDEYRTR